MCGFACVQSHASPERACYGWGSTASRLEPLWGGCLLFSTKATQLKAIVHETAKGFFNQFYNLSEILQFQWFTFIPKLFFYRRKYNNITWRFLHSILCGKSIYRLPAVFHLNLLLCDPICAINIIIQKWVPFRF